MKSLLTNLQMRKKFILAFLISAFIPQIILGIILFLNLHSIALENAVSNTKRNVQDVKNKLLDVLQNAVDISNKLYLDKKLLGILSTEYNDISKLYEDYTSYTEFSNLISIYYKNIHAIRVFAFNPTLLETGEFVKIDDFVRRQKWFVHAVEKDGKILWELVFDNDPFRPQYYFSLVRLIKNSFGEKLGVMVIYIKKERIDEILSQNGNTIVVTDKGTIVAANDQNLVGKSIDITPFGGDDRLVESVKINQQDFMAFVGTIMPNVTSGNYLKIISFFSKKEIFKVPNRISFFAFGVITTDLLISLFLMILFSKFITDRLTALNEKVNQISHGHLDTSIEILGKDEIGQLAENVREMAKNIKNLIEQVYLAEIQKQQILTKQREIQFEMLSSQINPHFLFNTLEAIRMKAVCNGQEEISHIVYLLSNLLRRSITVSSELISLKEEVEFVQQFLEIQKFRFGDRIDFDIQVDEELFDYKILPFIIQPLVENSIKHGIEPKVGKGYISIRIFKRKEKIVIKVEDNGIGMKEDEYEKLISRLKSDQKDAHVGLKNVYTRLKLFYGNEFEFLVKSKFESGTVVEITVPRKGDE
ncbi:integral membrane sensor signal transduction histidine kinase [Caldicellulosiruptor acetigenus I77R1B]|uniref:Integral membrane sensor signal transduction histidine kinase n=1 Tax=Caldicellulosiruptor acetigenus (strain ATCC 700853 / DSM 12137 / I77R1B) TaxID=632335 RepID=E4S9K2_CALA7|nr:sensor histidine kinase [Caldicellulosiruptor acetigenus]ADQ40056.1 integral membrane sensor signal transduction histidine kinase [Caldicellulosiruptor acetigenus I77R1B]